MSAWSLEQREALNSARGLYSISFWHRKCVEPVKRKHGSMCGEWNPFLDLIKEAA